MLTKKVKVIILSLSGIQKFSHLHISTQAHMKYIYAMFYKS
jgi:hypothetical protein